MLDAAGLGVVHVVAGARPAELGDDDALAGIGAAQLVVALDGAIDDLVDGRAFPIGQDMGGDEVDGRGQARHVFRLLGRLFGLLGIGHREPDVPGFAGRDRHWALALDALDDPDEVVDRLVAAQDGLVADHDRVDVAVALGERDRGCDLALVARLVLVDPHADRDPDAEFGGNAGHELDAAGRRIGANGARIRAQQLEVGANLLRRGPVAIVGMLRSRVWGIGKARQRPIDVRTSLLPLQETPQPGMHACNERDHNSDGAHETSTTRGGRSGLDPSPRCNRGPYS